MTDLYVDWGGRLFYFCHLRIRTTTMKRRRSPFINSEVKTFLQFCACFIAQIMIRVSA